MRELQRATRDRAQDACELLDRVDPERRGVAD
jgi:hypothetical protein